MRSSGSPTCGSRLYRRLLPAHSSELGRSPRMRSWAMNRSRRGRAASALCGRGKGAGGEGGGA